MTSVADDAPTLSVGPDAQTPQMQLLHPARVTLFPSNASYKGALVLCMSISVEARPANIVPLDIDSA